MGISIVRRLSILAVLAVLAVACPGPDTSDLISNVAVREGPHSPLSAVLTVSTDGDAVVSATVKGAGTEFAIPATESGREHALPVVGMRASTTYKITVRAEAADGTVDTDDTLSFTTGELPEGLPTIDITSDPDRMAPGVTILNLFAPDESVVDEDFGYIIALDAEGEVVWHYRTDFVVQDVSPTRGGTFLITVADLIVREIDVLGNTLAEWGTKAATDFTPEDEVGRAYLSSETVVLPIESTHHEVLELPNGNILTLSTEVVELSADDGAELCPDASAIEVLADVAVEFTREGEVVGEWRVAEAQPPTVRPGTALCADGFRFAVPVALYPHLASPRDWTHGNAVILDDERNQLIFSLRHTDSVIAIRYEDDEQGLAGELLWELSPEGDLALDGELSYHQHAVELQDDGTILLYDNGNDRPGTGEDGDPPYSRAVLYEVDVDAKTATQLWEHRDVEPWGVPVYADRVGDADRLPNGNVLITHGAPILEDGEARYIRLVEVVPSGDGSDGNEIVFDVRIGGSDEPGWTSYRADRLPTLYFEGLGLL